MTCSNAQADSAHYEPIFKEMIDSIHIDTWFDNFPKPLKIFLIGGISNDLIQIVQKWNFRAQQEISA